MFLDSVFQLSPALGIAVIMIGLYFLVSFRYRGPAPEEVLVRRVQFVLCLAGGIFLHVSFLLPSTPSLSTFGCPDSVFDVDSPEKVLSYLQAYNRELVRTVNAVDWTFRSIAIIVVGGLLAALHEYRTRLAMLSRPTVAREEG